MSQITLVLGGARSGKSRYAQELASASSNKVLFLATALPSDGDMARRIEAHRLARPPTWRTLESPRQLASPLGEALEGEAVVLIDCLTLWVSNVLTEHPGFPFEKAADLAAILDSISRESQEVWALARRRELALIAVSNEVGMGVAPAYPSGNAFREALGRVNQLWAAQADRVLLMVAGIPVTIKGIAWR